MKVQTEQLLSKLNAVKPGLASSKEDIEQSASFVFLGESVVSYNDEIGVSCPLKTDFKGAVKGEELIKLLSKTKEKELELVGEGNELKIKGKKMRAGVRMEAKITLPFQEIKLPEKMLNIPEKFLTALKFCAFSTSTDKARPLLNCIRIQGQHGISCDNHRLTRYDMGGKAAPYFPEEILVPLPAAMALQDFSPVQYGTNGGWIHFQMKDGLVFSCRTLAEKYPDVTRLLEVTGDKVEFPEDMKATLHMAQIFATGESSVDSRVEVLIVDDVMTVTGRGEYGWLKEKSRIKHGKGTARFHIHPEFLLDVLDLLRTVTIGERMIKMEGQDFIHVAALLVVTE